MFHLLVEAVLGDEVRHLLRRVVPVEPGREAVARGVGDGVAVAGLVLDLPLDGRVCDGWKKARGI